MNTKVDECKLISGKDALIALANGQDVEYMDTSNTFKSLGWGNAFGLETNLFFSDRFKFRLAPRTITINGIEVPAPAEDMDYHHQGIWILNSLEPKEYGYVVLDITDELPRYWWKSEEEIKQVVAALRQIFGGSHD